MLGWKSVQETIENITLNEMKMYLRQERFVLKEEGEYYAVLQRKGTELTVEGKKLPLEVALIQEANHIKIHLRYNTFVLFDTGDLKKELDLIIKRIIKKKTTNIEPLALFKALGDEKRLKTLNILAKTPMHNQELSQQVGLKPTTMSHHMAKLMDVGVVTVKQGEHNKSIYELDQEQLKILLNSAFDYIIGKD